MFSFAFPIGAVKDARIQRQVGGSEVKSCRFQTSSRHSIDYRKNKPVNTFDFNDYYQGRYVSFQKNITTSVQNTFHIKSWIYHHNYTGARGRRRSLCVRFAKFASHAREGTEPNAKKRELIRRSIVKYIAVHEKPPHVFVPM